MLFWIQSFFFFLKLKLLNIYLMTPWALLAHNEFKTILKLLEWDKVKITFDKPSYSQFNPVWIFPPLLNEESKQKMHICSKFLDFVWFSFLNFWNKHLRTSKIARFIISYYKLTDQVGVKNKFKSILKKATFKNMIMIAMQITIPFKNICQGWF